MPLYEEVRRIMPANLPLFRINTKTAKEGKLLGLRVMTCAFFRDNLEIIELLWLSAQRNKFLDLAYEKKKQLHGSRNST